MAPVDRWHPGRTGRRPDRGQIVLVGGLALAVTLLALAVVLNSAIYTENLATRDREAAPANAADLRGATADGVGTTLDRVNREFGGAGFGTLTGTHYGAALAEWRTMAVRHVAVRGGAVSVARDREMEGTRIADADPTTAFTPRTDSGSVDALGAGYPAPNWQVAAGVTVRRFVLDDVALSDLASAPPGDPIGTGAFFVEVRDGADADAWRVAVHEDSASGDLSVTVYDADAGSVVGTCTTGESSARVDITGATLNAERCEPLAFLGTLTGRATVYYVNADQAAGTYELTVDRAGHGTGGPLKDVVDAANYGAHCDGPTYYDDPASGSPSATAAVYSATVGLRYDHPSLTYEADVRAAPGEPGGAPDAPVVTEFAVTDSSGGSDAVFDLSWSTADPDGDPVTVEVTLHNRDDSTTNTYAVGGGSATVSEAGDAGDTYDVTLTASDGTTGRSVTETHVADGDATNCPP